MLQVKHLTLTHRKDLRTLVDDFSFVLNQGDRAVLIGEEGNGKSTLLKWLWSPGLIEPYCEWSGELAGDPGPMGYLAQDIPAEEKEGSVYDFCAASPAFFDLTPRELGEIARRCHREIGERAAASGADILLAWGELAEEYTDAARQQGMAEARFFREKQDLTQALIALICPGDLVWFKGSRSMRLEEVVERLYSALDE